MAYTATTFSGKLNSNEFINSLFNAYALVYTYSDNLSGGNEGLAGRFKTDGGQYKDKSVFTDVDVLFSRVWDSTDTNVLQPELKGFVKQEEIVLDKSRQIGLTVDNFLTKRAWMDEGNYDTFRSVLMSQIQKTKQAFEDTLINCFVGQAVNADQPVNEISITMPTDTDAEKQNRLRAMKVFQTIGDTYADLADYSRSYNANKYLKKFGKEDFILVFNNKYASEFRYVDTPTIFHKDDLLASGTILNHRYFGSAVTTGTADGTSHRACNEYLIRTSDVAGTTYSATGTYAFRVLPGDLLPKGTPISASEAFATVASIKLVGGAGDTQTIQNASCASAVLAYAEDSKVICKLVHKSAVKYLSGVSVGTEFVNGKNHTQNHYFTWMFAEPKLLNGYPVITVKEA